MSKLYLKGNAAGTGRLILESPDTDDELVMTFPARSGTLVAGDAEGMPVMADGTPVVESGSNSDGYWTKWGDGTAVASSPSIPVASDEAFGSIYRSANNLAWYYPITFIYATGAGETGDVGSCIVGGQAGNYSHFNFRAMSGISLPAEGARISVQGRWK